MTLDELMGLVEAYVDVCESMTMQTHVFNWVPPEDALELVRSRTKLTEALQNLLEKANAQH